MQIVRVSDRLAYINRHDGNWIKVPELFAETLHTCVLMAEHLAIVSCDTMHFYSDATRNGSPSTSSKKGFSYRWNVAYPTVENVIRLQYSM